MDTEQIKVLLVDDDEFFGFLVQKFLTNHGYLVDKATSAQAGFELFCANNYHVCLLDVVMPEKNGITLAQEIKAANKNVPIIFITANKDKQQTLLGFEVGADGYLVKPFPMEELLVRMQAILRRTVKPHSADDFIKFNIGKYVFNYSTQTITIGENERRLTTKETELLRLLILHKNELLNRSFALQTIWHISNKLACRSMDTFITKLRKVLGKDKEIEIINVHGKGYKLLVKQDAPVQ